MQPELGENQRIRGQRRHQQTKHAAGRRNKNGIAVAVKHHIGMQQLLIGSKIEALGQKMNVAPHNGILIADGKRNDIHKRQDKAQHQ